LVICEFRLREVKLADIYSYCTIAKHTAKPVVMQAMNQGEGSSLTSVAIYGKCLTELLMEWSPS